MMPESHPTQFLRRQSWLLHTGGLAITAGMAAIVYGLCYISLERSQSALERTARACEAFLATSDAVRTEHAELTRRYAEAEQLVSSLMRRIPESAQEAEFLAELAVLAKRTGFVLHEYRPGDVHPVEWHNELEIQLHAEGSYQSLCQFLMGLESLDRFCRLSEFHVTSPSESPEIQRSRMALQVFFATAEDARKESPSVASLENTR